MNPVLVPIRCSCGRKLAFVEPVPGQIEIKCPKCGLLNVCNRQQPFLLVQSKV